MRDLSRTETVHVAIRVNHPAGATNIKNPFVRLSPNVLSASRPEFENDDRFDLFIFMGLHSGLFSLVGARDCASINNSLSGNSIGVDAKTSGFALVLEAMLHARGFAGNDYQLIEVGAWGSRYRALLEGKITATLLTEPFVKNALGGGLQAARARLRADLILPAHMWRGESTLGRTAPRPIDPLYSSVSGSDSVVFRNAKSPILPRHPGSTE